MINKRLHTPEGVKDFLPDEFAYKRNVEKITERTFLSWGYKRVSTPTLEYSEVFSDTGSVPGPEKYRFLSREGDILVLRSDMTPAICRMAAGEYSEGDLPLRFYYVENMFRYNEKNQGKMREMTHCGIELMGESGVEGDCEVIICAAVSLLNLGLKSFKIDIGHADFLEGALEEAGISGEAALSIKDAIIDKDYIKVTEITEGFRMEEKKRYFLQNLPLYLGGEDVLDKAKDIFKNKRSLDALENMQKIYDYLKECGFEKYICFDLGIVPQLDYYTGIIFRGYASGTGYSILSGGRYDRLSECFESDFPAVGFVLKIDELIPVLETNNISFKNKKADTLLIYTAEGKSCAVKTGIKLRKSGMNIENYYGELDRGLDYAAEKGFGGVLYFSDSENVRIFNIAEDQEVSMKVSELAVSEE